MLGLGEEEGDVKGKGEREQVIREFTFYRISEACIPGGISLLI